MPLMTEVDAPKTQMAVSLLPASVDYKARTIQVVMTSRVLDREGDVVEPKGLDFANFLKNPVVLWAHDMGRPPIGKVLQVEGKDSDAGATVQFADSAFAKEIFELYAGGFMRAWSIGFIPKKWQRIEKKAESGERELVGFHVQEAEVVELSAVPVPANPEALAKAMKKGIALSEEVRQELTKDVPEWKARTYSLLHDKRIEHADAEGFVQTGEPTEAGVPQTADGYTLRDSAFSKSLAEAVSAGKVPTETVAEEDPKVAGSAIEFQPLQVNKNNEITEAKILRVIVKQYVPKTDAPKTPEPPEGTPEESGRDEAGSVAPQEKVFSAAVARAKLKRHQAELAMLELTLEE